VIRWVGAGCGDRVCNGAKPGAAPPGAFVAVRAGTLDDTSWRRPTAHFWTRSAQPWAALPEGGDGLAWLRSIEAQQRRSDG